MIPLAVPNLAGNEARYLQECIETNFVSSVGPFVDRFEKMVAEACGTRGAVATASGTAALHVMMVALGVEPSDLVIVPTLSFIATANAVSYTGARPVLLDISVEGWTLNPAVVETFIDGECTRRGGNIVHRATGGRIAAMLCVHTLGHPADMVRLEAISAATGIPLICDAAAAIGARYFDRPVTAMGRAAALSFNGNKTVTCGGGGAVVSNDAELLSRVRHLSTTARTSPEYDHDRVGFNYRMTNLQAAVGCAQMEQLDGFVSAKRRIARRYADAFAGLRGVAPFPEVQGVESAHWFSGFTVSDGTRPSARETLEQLNARGVAARQFWKPIHLQPPYAGCVRGNVSVSEALWPRIVTLPCSTGLSDADQKKVIDRVIEVVNSSVAAVDRA